ncbi:MAG: hypothetical protein DRJ60_05120 [Thermoprotei archaeon]|nr:MAG: hypothetical protein DRJ60_05120 [Thermoprotei archaeon]
MVKVKQASPFVVALALALMIVGVASAQALTVLTPTSGAIYYPGDTLIVSGRAAPGASVSIKLYNPNGVLVAFGVVEADPSTGSFSLNLCTLPTPPGPEGKWPYGTYTLEVYSAGETKSVNINLNPRGGTIAVKVVDESGNPVQGATVEVVGTGISALTQADGSATITISPGTYDIKIYKSGYAQVLLEDKSVVAGETLDLGTVTLVSLESKIAQLENRIAQLEEQIAQLQSQLEEQADQISTLTSEIEGLKTQVTMISTLQTVTQNLQSAVQQLTSTTQSLSDTVNSLSGTVSGMQMLSYAGIGAGIIGIILAVVAIAYVAKKVKA